MTSLRVDGGAAQNDFLLQFQADVSRIVVERSSNPETTVLGAAYLAGLLSGVWKNPEELQMLPQNTTYFRASLPLEEAKCLMGQWTERWNGHRDALNSKSITNHCCLGNRYLFVHSAAIM